MQESFVSKDLRKFEFFVILRHLQDLSKPENHTRHLNVSDTVRFRVAKYNTALIDTFEKENFWTH